MNFIDGIIFLGCWFILFLFSLFCSTVLDIITGKTEEERMREKIERRKRK